MRISPFSSPRAAALVASVIAGSVLTGCGLGSGTTQPPVTSPTAASSGNATTAPTPVVTPAPTPTPMRKPTQKPTQGNGDSAGDHKPATAGGGICARLTSSDVGKALGSSVTGAALPGGGCGFNPSGSMPPAGTFIETVTQKTATMDAAKADATSSVEGTPEDLTGIGDAAFVVTGTAFGGPDLQGGGAVRVGTRLISVTVTENQGLPRGRVRALVIALLKLAVAKMA